MAESSSENMEPPRFSIPQILKTIQEVGLLKAMDDDDMGPHVHLMYLLIMVFFIAVIIGFIVYFFM